MTDSRVIADQGAGQSIGTKAKLRARLPFILPGLLFLIVAIAFAYGLTRDPRAIPSVLIDKPVPTFALAPVQGRSLGLSSADLKGEVSLVNFFASWCVACLVEHPLFVELKKKGAVPVHGINYKDWPADAAAWLDKYGDPYARTGADLDGRVAIDWGVYGLPETFVVDRRGRIAYKHIGPISKRDMDEKILPLIEKLRR
jgi:cytochrome c biogenesis protein CcmG/thiol:disulfide interchange protein DsbE